MKPHVVALFALLALSAPASAQLASPFPVKIESHDVLPGALETVVELQNTRDIAISGRVELTTMDIRSFGAAPNLVSAEAPFALGPHATGRLVLVPTVGNRYGLVARVVLADGTKSANEATSGNGRYGSQGPNAFVDLGGHAALLGALNDAQVLSSGATSRETVAAVAPSATLSGYVALPTTLGGYSLASVVHVGTRQFVELGQPELTALVDFVAHGGTLALSVDDSAQLADPKLAALLGGVVRLQDVPASSFGDAPTVTRQAANSYDGSQVEAAPRATPPADRAVAGYFGGNMALSAYGSTAAYGLGRVVLLPVHAARNTDVPWVIGKLAELTLDSTLLRKRAVSEIPSDVNDRSSMQHALDPNQRFRVTLGVATALLLAYGAFVAWRLLRDQQRRRLFRSFVWLPSLALALSAGIVGLGFLSRGSQRGIRRVILVEGGAGFGLVSIDEHRGYFTSGSDLLTLVSHTPRSLLYADALGPVHQRDGFSFLRDKPQLPWQTTVTRELRMEQSEQQIALGEIDGLPWITNRTQVTLEDVLVTASTGSVYLVPRVAPGEHFTASAQQLARHGMVPNSSGFYADGFSDLAPEDLKRIEARYRVFATLAQQRDVAPEGTLSLIALTSQNEVPFARAEAETSALPLQTVASYVHIVGEGGAP